MKIFGHNSFSNILYYLFRSVSAFLLLLVLYIDACFLTQHFTLKNGRFHIDIPLTDTSINGNYQFRDILTISLGLLFGALFFFVLSNIFKALVQHIIFNKNATKSLTLFTGLNLVVGPILYFIIHFLIMQKTNFNDIHNLILHLIFGMIALFLTYIFKKGNTVQIENDLTI